MKFITAIVPCTVWMLVILFPQESFSFVPCVGRSSSRMYNDLIRHSLSTQVDHEHHQATDLFFEELQWAEEGQLHMHHPHDDDWIVKEFHSDDYGATPVKRQPSHHEWFSEPATTPTLDAQKAIRTSPLTFSSEANRQPAEWFSQHVPDNTDASRKRINGRVAASLSPSSNGSDWFTQASQWRNEEQKAADVQSNHGQRAAYMNHADWFAAAVFDN